MSLSPVNSSQPVRPAQPAADPRAPQRATPQDVRAIQDAFAAAAKRGQLPVGEPKTKGMPGEKGLQPLLDKGVPGKRGEAPDRPAGLLDAKAETLHRASRDETHDQPLMGLMQQGQAIAAPTVVLAQPHVDPSVFADMLTQLWMREKDRTTREIRVSFGDDAWPATGARLRRLDDGSLSVSVAVGERGSAMGDSLSGLRERLESRGLLIADVDVEETGPPGR